MMVSITQPAFAEEVDLVSSLYTVTLERDPSGALVRASIGVPLIDEYLVYLATIGRSPTTWSSYAYDLAIVCRWLARESPGHTIEDALRALTPAQILRFVEDQRQPRADKKFLALGTVARRLVALARFFDWAALAGVVGHNPVPRDYRRGAFDRPGSATSLVRVPTPLPRPAPADEIVTFAGSLRTWRDRALVALLVGAGLRLSEALGLRLGDLDWGGKQVFVQRGKGGRSRYAMVPDPAWTALKVYLETERPDPPADRSATDTPVFVVLHGQRRGQPLTAAGVQSLFRHHRQQAHAPNVTPHRLRHTCGTELHRAGLALELIQEQLGHRRLESTRLYLHLSNERLRAAYRAIEGQLYRAPAGEDVR